MRTCSSALFACTVASVGNTYVAMSPTLPRLRAIKRTLNLKILWKLFASRVVELTASLPPQEQFFGSAVDAVLPRPLRLYGGPRTVLGTISYTTANT